MTPPLDGVRVVEVTTHVFAPMAGAVLAEWGADVVKVEHPEEGDPHRGLVTTGLHPLHGGVDPYVQAANRGKRSVGLDLRHADGRAVGAALYRRATTGEPAVIDASLLAAGMWQLQPDIVSATLDGADPDPGRPGRPHPASGGTRPRC